MNHWITRALALSFIFHFGIIDSVSAKTDALGQAQKQKVLLQGAESRIPRLALEVKLAEERLEKIHSDRKLLRTNLQRAHADVEKYKPYLHRRARRFDDKKRRHSDALKKYETLESRLDSNSKRRKMMKEALKSTRLKLAKAQQKKEELKQSLSKECRKIKKDHQVAIHMDQVYQDYLQCRSPQSKTDACEMDRMARSVNDSVERVAAAYGKSKAMEKKVKKDKKLLEEIEEISKSSDSLSVEERQDRISKIYDAMSSEKELKKIISPFADAVQELKLEQKLPKYGAFMMDTGFGTITYVAFDSQKDLNTYLDQNLMKPDQKKSMRTKKKGSNPGIDVYEYYDDDSYTSDAKEFYLERNGNKKWEEANWVRPKSHIYINPRVIRGMVEIVGWSDVKVSDEKVYLGTSSVVEYSSKKGRQGIANNVTGRLYFDHKSKNSGIALDMMYIGDELESKSIGLSKAIPNSKPRKRFTYSVAENRGRTLSKRFRGESVRNRDFQYSFESFASVCAGVSTEVSDEEEKTRRSSARGAER